MKNRVHHTYKTTNNKKYKAYCKKFTQAYEPKKIKNITKVSKV